jgi:hypothetical protein
MIRICKVDGGYLAEITPPHGRGVPWRLDEPRSKDKLIKILKARGCHQTDIGDAFYEADPDWLA